VPKAKSPKTPAKAAPKKGRPTTYRPEYCEIVRKLLRMGNTMREIADILGTSDRGLINWRMANPEFDDAFFSGLKDPNARVEVSLYKQAIGYFMDDEKIEVINGEIVRVPIRKWYPPSPSATIFWGKIKMGWRDDAAEAPEEPTTIEHEGINETPRQVARRLALILYKGGRESA